MPAVPSRFSRPRLVTEDQLRQTHEAAVTMLIEKGIRVNHAAAGEAAVEAGLRVMGDQVLVERSAISEFVAASMAEGASLATGKGLTRGGEATDTRC